MVNWFKLQEAAFETFGCSRNKFGAVQKNLHLSNQRLPFSSNITKNFTKKQRSLVANDFNPTMSNWKLESLASGTNQACGTFHRAQALHHSPRRVAWEVEEWHLEADKHVKYRRWWVNHKNARWVILFYLGPWWFYFSIAQICAPECHVDAQQKMGCTEFH